MRSFSMSLLVFLLLLTVTSSAAAANDSFVFNGFVGSNLTLDGVAAVTPDGLLQLTNRTQNMKGHAFYPSPLRFKPSSSAPTLSFSATFVFGILAEVTYLGGNGITFVISRTTDFSTATASQFFALFNSADNGNSSNHVFAVELDTVLNPEFDDINNNHVGIDVNGLNSTASLPAAYYDDVNGTIQNLTLISGQPMQVWVDYDGTATQLNVTLAPVPLPKPKSPLLSAAINLTDVMEDLMYVGFSSTNGGFHTRHYVLASSFKMNGQAAHLDYSKLPSLPAIATASGDDSSKALEIWLPVSFALLVILIVPAVVVFVRRRKYAELLEDWEREYGPHRFKYKDLFIATNGFKDKGLLGSGGFGRVYKGTMPNSDIDVAVKRVSHGSRQGMKEFVAEIVSIGQLRHRNLVQLLGYCRRKGELLLVYDYMPSGSLDKFLYDRSRPSLNWAQRFRIIKGVAAGLLYLHEDWEQVVIHRDVKPSNVLLDGELNGRLGDFGLARLYDHGTDPHTTHVVGTMGYLAPELTRTGKATTATDVFSFGTFLLEVTCGRRPVVPLGEEEDMMLIGWVLSSWHRGAVTATRDPRLGEEYYCAEEVELVLKLGLLCSNPVPGGRPSMRQVVQYLDGDAPLPELPPSYISFSSVSPFEGFDSFVKSSFSSESGQASSSLSGSRQ